MSQHKHLPIAEFCSAIDFNNLQARDKEYIRVWVRDHKEEVYKACTRISTSMLDTFALLAVSFLENNIYKRQIRIQLFQSIGQIIEGSENLRTRRHHRLFHHFMKYNPQFSAHVVKDVIQLYSDEAVRLLEHKPHYFQEFFRGSRSRSEGWFQHFHYDGKMLYGAKAIERFTFNHRVR